MNFNPKSKILQLTILVFLLLNFGCQKKAGADPVAPDFLLPDLAGHMTSLKQHRGNIVVLDFWVVLIMPGVAATLELVFSTPVVVQMLCSMVRCWLA